MAEIFGADFAWTKPDPDVLRANGWSFVLGYISSVDDDKNLNNWKAYADAGLGVGFVWENGTLPNYAAGAADAQFCENWLRGHGVPIDAPLFVAFDTDAVDADAARMYMTAFNAHTQNPVGPYGKFDLIEALVTPGQQPCQIGWQTAAWSQDAAGSDRLSQKCNVYQRYTHNHPLPGYAGNQYDENVLVNPLHFAGSNPTPAPAPAPTPPPPPVDPWLSLPDLTYDTTSQSNAHWQAFLAHNYPLYANQWGPLPATGYFGHTTANWTLEFQDRSGVQGGNGTNFGPQTKRAAWLAGFRG